MDTILQGVEGAMCFVDDVLISGRTLEEHLSRLTLVLQRFQKYSVRVRKEKCTFPSPSVSYLGHRIDAEGQHPLPDKLEAITRAPTPRNVIELQSFLGLLNYYGRFIPNLSSIIHPLNALLSHDATWR